jgi:ferredoxin
MLVLGISFLLISLFVGRPYCRYFCPYGVLLRIFSRFSRWRVTVTPKECLNCRLCEESCPFGAIEVSKEEPMRPLNRDRRRMAFMLLLLPVLIAIGGYGGSKMGPAFSRMHARVLLAERIQEEETGGAEGTTDASKAFRDTGESINSLYEEARAIRADFIAGGWFFGGFLGLVLAGKLISLSVLRRREEYEAGRAGCLACGRCFSYCPVELERRK